MKKIIFGILLVATVTAGTSFAQVNRQYSYLANVGRSTETNYRIVLVDFSVDEGVKVIKNIKKETVLDSFIEDMQVKESLPLLDPWMLKVKDFYCPKKEISVSNDPKAVLEDWMLDFSDEGEPMVLENWMISQEFGGWHNKG